MLSCGGNIIEKTGKTTKIKIIAKTKDGWLFDISKDEIKFLKVENFSLYPKIGEKYEISEKNIFNPKRNIILNKARR
jgi:hypothetical protein